MSEVMTSEAIIDAEWLLAGYWTKPRFVFQTEKGAWSDVDVLAYHPEKKHLVLSESKVHGPKNRVFAYTSHSREKYGSILDFDDGGYLSFLRHLPTLCQDGAIFGKFDKMVRSVTVQLVCNYAIADDLVPSVHEELNENLKSYGLPCKASFQLDSTLDVIARLLAKERDFEQGKRYGNPVLDLVREINRYLHPAVLYAGHGSEGAKAIRNQMVGKFLAALGLAANET